MPTREFYAIFTDDSGEPLRHLADKFGGVRCIGGSENLRFAGAVHGAIRDIRRHRVIEQDNVLADQCNIGAQAPKLKFSKIVAVECDAPGSGTVKTRHEIGHSGFARTGGAYQCYCFARRDLQVDAIQCRAFSAFIT